MSNCVTIVSVDYIRFSQYRKRDTRAFKFESARSVSCEFHEEFVNQNNHNNNNNSDYNNVDYNIIVEL